MNAIRAIWKNGKTLPSQPVDWPDGSEVVVELFTSAEDKVGLDESEWRHDAESLADWDAWMRTIEPPVLIEEERQSYARYEEEFERFNLEAVRKQMESAGHQ